MKKEFVMRGQTASGETEILNFSGYKQGYAYRLVEFQIYPSTSIGGQQVEACGIINAGKTTAAPTDPNFNDEGTIATTLMNLWDAPTYGASTPITVINDTYLITQNLILMVQDTAGNPINWQCRFESVKMTGAEEAAVNYKQYTISDE